MRVTVCYVKTKEERSFHRNVFWCLFLTVLSTSMALLEPSLAVCMRSLKVFEGNCEIKKMSNSPAFLCMRLQMCINALFLEHFYGHCIKTKLYMHVSTVIY